MEEHVSVRVWVMVVWIPGDGIVDDGTVDVLSQGLEPLR